MNPVILLSGPVGAGKSAVARELIKQWYGPLACIEGDVFWSFIAKGAGGSSQKNFGMIMASMIAAAIPYALYGYDVIVDFSIPPWFIETALKLLKKREIPLHYVVLCPDEKTCAKRAATRSEGAIADYKLYHDMYLTFGSAQKFIIPDNTSDAPAIAVMVKEGYEEGTFKIEEDFS